MAHPDGASYIAFLRVYAIQDSRRTFRAYVLGITSGTHDLLWYIGVISTSKNETKVKLAMPTVKMDICAA